MTRFYHRLARLTVWRPRPTPTTPLGEFFGAAVPNAVTIDAGSGIRVQWSISKSLGSDPNTCEIVVTNLAERTRAEFQELPRKVTLEAGYDGELQHLFSGYFRWAVSEHTRPGWETKLEVADGARAYRAAMVDRSMVAGTTALTAIREAATALGLELPRAAEQRPELQRQFANGVRLAGRASDALSRLLAPFDLGWSIQDGQLQILGAADVRPGQAIVIDEGAGMIGSPAFEAPAASKGKKAQKGVGSGPVLKVSTLLYPQVIPGGTIEVRSLRARGQYKVRKVEHEGDTHGEAMTTIEAVTA